MRIGMILDYTFPPDPRVENEAVSLVNSGYEVFLFCLTYGNQPLKETIQGIKVCRYTSNKLEYKLSALAYTVPFYTNLMSKKISHFLKENAIEAIHIHDIRIADAVLKANKKFDLPTVLDLHDNMPEVMKLYPHLNKFPGKYIIKPSLWKKKEESFISKVTKVITVSQEFIDEVVARTKIHRDKIVLVPNTVRESFYKEAIIKAEIVDRYKDNITLLYLGDTHLRRGLQTAIAALENILLEISNVKLVIVGTNSTDSVLKQQVKDLELQDYVDFEGWQDVALFPSYIKASTICISPLHRNIQHDVAYTNKLFQYMSMGKPVLVSNATAQEKLVNKISSGMTHKDRDVGDFVEKVLLLAKDSQLREQMGANGRSFVENEFTWEKTSKNLVHLYDNLNV